MKKLLKNKKGFTLIEMLIVVAIIVILVAVSVPTFTANLDNAKSSTDAANLRAAKSAAVLYQIQNGMTGAVYYDANDGVIVTQKTDIAEAYGQSSSTVAGSTGTPKGNIIEITSNSGTLVYKWVAK